MPVGIVVVTPSGLVTVAPYRKGGQEKNRDFFGYIFLLCFAFSRSASRYPVTKNSAKINFTVNNPVVHKLDCEENLPFEMFALSPLRAANCVGVKS